MLRLDHRRRTLSLHRGRYLLASHSNQPGCRHTPSQLYIVEPGNLPQPSHIQHRARALAIPCTQACVYKRWQAIPALTGTGIIQEQLTGSLSGFTHVLYPVRIARSQLLVNRVSGTRVIPHFTPLSQTALPAPQLSLSEQGSIREGSPDRSLGPSTY